MFKAVLIVALIAASQASDFEQWTQFKNRHNKRYGVVEELVRFEIFKTNLRRIEEHNAGRHSFRLGVNEFADLTNAEFRAQRNGYKATGPRPAATARFHPSRNGALPSTVDWRNSSLVTGVKNQGQCGSCWAFSAVASLEGQHAKATGKLVSLSEQNLVDCSTPEGNQGCEGGLMDQAFEYIKQNGGIDTEKSYPYEEKDDKCQFNKANIGATLTGFVDIQSGNETALQAASATVGPISVAIDASSFFFQLYSGGVYTFNDCGNKQENLDHGVTVVGYGTDSGTDYWLIKNSWGATWGENGYIRLARNADNLCGVATDASYPTV